MESKFPMPIKSSGVGVASPSAKSPPGVGVASSTPGTSAGGMESKFPMPIKSSGVGVASPLAKSPPGVGVGYIN